MSPRTHRSTRNRLKKKLLLEMKQVTTKTEKVKLQANIVTIEEAHPRQPRCQYFGEEIQMDACVHPWFGGFKTTLYAAIDDVTGTLVVFILTLKKL